MLQVTPRLQIPDDELSMHFALSGGPGGQNVNKVSTKVELRFQLASSRVLTAEVKARLKARHPSMVTQAGELLVVSTRHRSQLRNRADAEERLCALIREALVRPKPRHETKVPKSQKRRRRDDKRKRGEVKRGRGRVGGDE
jgi:ribosome-associated protein